MATRLGRLMGGFLVQGSEQASGWHKSRSARKPVAAAPAGALVAAPCTQRIAAPAASGGERIPAPATGPGTMRPDPCNPRPPGIRLCLPSADGAAREGGHACSSTTGYKRWLFGQRFL